MIDKVQKIREEVERLQNELIQEREKGYGSDVDDACILELQNVLTYIDSMQEEPVSNPIDFEKELYKAFGQVKDFTLGVRIAKRFYDMGKNSRETVSGELEDYINELSKQFPEVSFAKLSRIGVRVAKWQKENLWEPADGDDLPIFDREVIALLKNGEVVFAHRPNPDGWDGKSLTSGKIEHYTPKTYDKGGWNIPNVKYWLDVELQKEIEL